jgi:hypothetical protein
LSVIAPNVEKRNHIFAVISATVLVLGLVRALLVVIHSPVLGYTDAARSSVPAYVAGGALLAVLVAIAVTTALALKSRPIASLVHALLFFLLVADPVATLWLNSGRYESVCVVAIYGAAAMIAVMTSGRGSGLHGAIFVALLLLFISTLMGAFGPAESPLRSLTREISASASLEPAGFAVSASDRVRRISELPPHVMSFAALLANAPITARMMAAMAMMISFPFALIAYAWTRRRRPQWTIVPAVYTALVASFVCIALAAVFGSVAASHLLPLGWLAMLAAIVLLPFMAWNLAQDAWSGPVGLVCAVAIALIAAGWFSLSRHEPLAIGAIERVTPGPNRTLEVGGWALDPRGVRRVFATVGGGPATDAVLGNERRDLQAGYPGYPDAVTGGFQMTIPSNAWRESQTLRVYAESRLGAVTEIAQTDIRAAP